MRHKHMHILAENMMKLNPNEFKKDNPEFAINLKQTTKADNF